MPGRIDRPTVLRVLLLPLTLLGAGRASAGQAPARPLSVLLIAVDDMNCALGCYGHPVAKSPNIDRLADRGVRFERAYCQYPLCNPSRTSFLSGRRPDTTRILDNTTPPRTFLEDVALLPEHFRANGYYTARSGKIIHTAPAFPEDAIRWDWSDESMDAGQSARIARAFGNGEDGVGPVARRVAYLLEQHKDRPFFIAAGLTNTHCKGEKLKTSFVPAPKYLQLYPPEDVAPPDEPAGHLANIPPIALTHFTQELSDLELRRTIAGYYACVTQVDEQVGALSRVMDRLNLWDRTVVVLFGDHGQHLGEHGGLWRKETVFEESARVPLIVVAPGARAGAVSPRLVELVDLYPTLVQLCGLPTPDGLEGTSFVTLLNDPERPWKGAAFTTVKHRDRAVDVLGRSLRTERYRYTEWDDGARGVELYDHQDDPHELVNLARDPAHADALATLRGRLNEGWSKATPPAPVAR